MSIQKFFGKVVRVDLLAMLNNVTNCTNSWRKEAMVNGTLVVTGTTSAHPCVIVLDLTTIHPNARGFRKGFVNYPYAYLSPGEVCV